jgi:phage baseplate assembly protein gpV
VSFGGPSPPAGDHDLCGVYYGIVTQNDDLDGPGGRVKVRFPWMPEGDRDQSRWAPVAAPMAGERFGDYWMPEVNDVVVVVFLAGDLRAPVVVGGQWNEKDPPPEKNEDGKNDFRLLKSRSGHRLILDDSSKTKVVLSDRKDQNVAACGPFGSGGSGPNTYEVPAPGGINGSPSKGVGVSAARGTLNIFCPSGKLELSAMHVEITAAEAADVSGKSSLTLESATQAGLGSSGSGTYKGSQLKIGV